MLNYEREIMSDEKKPVMLIAHESLTESILSDAFSTATLLGSVAIGVMVGSSALQWIAGLLWVVFFLGRSIGRENARHCYSFEEARKRIDEAEAKYKP